MSKLKIPTTPMAADKLPDELGELSAATLTWVPYTRLGGRIYREAPSRAATRPQTDQEWLTKSPQVINRGGVR